MGNFISQQFNFGGGPKIKFGIFSFLFYLLMPFGTLFLRLFKLNGSLDKIWLLLLSFPPFSLLTIIAARLGWIKAGRGGKPFDRNLWIPVVVRLISFFILGGFTGIFQIIMKILLISLAIVVANLLRTIKFRKCTKENTNTPKLLSGIIFKSILQYGFACAFVFLSKYIPLFGAIVKMLSFIPGFKVILWCLGFATMYAITNIIEGNLKTDDDICKGGYKGHPIVTIVAFVALLFAEIKDKLF